VHLGRGAADEGTHLLDAGEHRVCARADFGVVLAEPDLDVDDSYPRGPGGGGTVGEPLQQRWATDPLGKSGGWTSIISSAVSARSVLMRSPSASGGRDPAQSCKE
jgi:hypothetical protein